MTNYLLSDLREIEVVAPKRFEGQRAAPFIDKPVLEETKRADSKAISDFFLFLGGKLLTEVIPADVQICRGHVRTRRQRTATIAFKMAVVRPFFEYMKAVDLIPLNPATTKLVPSTRLPTEPAKDLFTTKEVRYLLTEGLPRRRRSAHETTD
jgi:site-specific recombinase XerD